MQLVTIDYINDLFPKSRKSLCLNMRDAATVIGVHENTLRSWAKEKAIGPEYIKVNNGPKARVLYPKLSLLNWLEDSKVKTI
jgi:hypothetical protein